MIILEIIKINCNYIIKILQLKTLDLIYNKSI